MRYPVLKAFSFDGLDYAAGGYFRDDRVSCSPEELERLKAEGWIGESGGEAAADAASAVVTEPEVEEQSEEIQNPANTPEGAPPDEEAHTGGDADPDA